MKKKTILLVALSTAVAGSALVGGLALSKGNFVVEPVKATAKEFTFDAKVGAEQFEDHYEISKPANISVVTGVGSNMETYVTVPKNADYDYGKGFGDNGRFVRTWETYSGSNIEVTIGVNNLTSIAVVYGCDKTTYTAATEVHCYFDVKDEDGDWHTDVSGSSGSAFNTDLDLDWAKTTQTYTVTAVRVRTGASGGSVYYGEPVYIKSITLNWSC